VEVAGGGSTAVVLVADGGVEVVIWRLDRGVVPDLSVVDRLARLQLTARRMGWSIGLRNPGDELRGLLDLAGLADVIGELGPALPG
jgi:hypothetical protein